MDTYMIGWDPSVPGEYSAEDIASMLGGLEFGDLGWLVQNDPGIQSGDNFNVILPDGRIAMKGFFTTSPDTNGETGIRPEWILVPGKADMPETDFRPGNGSAVLMTREQRTITDFAWERFLRETTPSDDGVSSARNHRPQAGIEDAMSLAAETLYDRRDPDGRPSALRSIRLAGAADSESEAIVGILQGCLGDGVTAGFLRDKGFSEDIVDTLLTLRKGDDETLDEYTERVSASGDGTACRVLERILALE